MKMIDYNDIKDNINTEEYYKLASDYYVGRCSVCQSWASGLGQASERDPSSEARRQSIPPSPHEADAAAPGTEGSGPLQRRLPRRRLCFLG